jgi:hypothetical protein
LNEDVIDKNLGKSGDHDTRNDEREADGDQQGDCLFRAAQLAEEYARGRRP